jgi:hypothetical protein
MTLQVGIVGTDGIVIASDQLCQQQEYGSSICVKSSKFHQGPGVICCCSGDSVAEVAAYGVRNYEWAAVTDPDAIRLALIEIGNTTIDKFVAQYGPLAPVIRKVLVVLHDQLWLLIIGVGTSVANRIEDKVVAGDIHNTCRYFTNKFAVACYHRPMNKAIRLAAYTILAAGEENPHGVRYLEMFVIPNGRDPIRIKSEQTQELELWFKQTVETIGAMLLASFEIAPST